LKNDELIQTARELVKQDIPDYEQAYKLLDLAYKRGSPEATYAIATWYLHGGHFLEQDYVKGTEYLKKAAEMKWPDAMYDLAVSYERGVYVSKNQKKAFLLYLQSALRGSSEAVYEVSRCYYFGIGTRKNKVLGAIWYDRAEELGSVRNDD